MEYYLIAWLVIVGLFLWGWSRFKRYEKRQWNKTFMIEQERYKDEGESYPPAHLDTRHNQ